MTDIFKINFGIPKTARWSLDSAFQVLNCRHKSVIKLVVVF